jgi:type I restriction enzyme S subunit
MNRRFVCAMLNSPSVRKAATAQISGVGRPRLNLAKIRSIVLPIPPAREQERIVAVIDEQFSRLDLADAALRSARQRCALLHKRLLWTLNDWPLVALAELLAQPLSNGRSVPTAENGSSFPVLRLTALRRGTIDLTQRKRGAWQRRDAERFLVQRGDFLIARGNGSLPLVGRGGLVEIEPDEVAYPDTMIRARVDRDRMSPEFLRCVWDSSVVRRQIERAAKTTAGIYKVNQRDLGALDIPAPSLEDQSVLVSELERQKSILDSLTISIDHALARSKHLRWAVLDRASSGQLVRQDETDEPASEFLARVCAEHIGVSRTHQRRKQS